MSGPAPPTDSGPLPARLYVLSNRLLRATKGRAPARWHRAVKVAVRAVWLGLLGRHHLHWLDERFWSGDGLGFDRYRDNVYGDDEFNLGGLFEWERKAVERHFAGARRILVSSAGGGREVVALLRMGFTVDGFECSPRLLAVARDLLERRGLRADLRPAPRDGCADFGRGYDGVVVGWGSYGLIQGKARRVAFLRQLRRQAVAGAPILLSFFTRPSGARAFAATAAIAGAVRRALGRPAVEVGDLLEPIYFHFFTEEQVRAELLDGGFELRHYAAEGYGHAVGTAV